MLNKKIIALVSACVMLCSCNKTTGDLINDSEWDIEPVTTKGIYTYGIDYEMYIGMYPVDNYTPTDGYVYTSTEEFFFDENVKYKIPVDDINTFDYEKTVFQHQFPDGQMSSSVAFSGFAPNIHLRTDDNKEHLITYYMLTVENGQKYTYRSTPVYLHYDAPNKQMLYIPMDSKCTRSNKPQIVEMAGKDYLVYLKNKFAGFNGPEILEVRTAGDKIQYNHYLGDYQQFSILPTVVGDEMYYTLCIMDVVDGFNTDDAMYVYYPVWYNKAEKVFALYAYTFTDVESVKAMDVNNQIVTLENVQDIKLRDTCNADIKLLHVNYTNGKETGVYSHTYFVQDGKITGLYDVDETYSFTNTMYGLYPTWHPVEY